MLRSKLLIFCKKLKRKGKGKGSEGGGRGGGNDGKGVGKGKGIYRRLNGTQAEQGHLNR